MHIQASSFAWFPGSELIMASSVSRCRRRAACQRSSRNAGQVGVGLLMGGVAGVEHREQQVTVGRSAPAVPHTGSKRLVLKPRAVVVRRDNALDGPSEWCAGARWVGGAGGAVGPIAPTAAIERTV